MEWTNFWTKQLFQSFERASFIFSCYDASHSYYQLLPMERYIARIPCYVMLHGEKRIKLSKTSHGVLRSRVSSFRLEWVRALSPSAFISSGSQKMPEKVAESLDRWPTAVLLLSTLRITVDQGHGSGHSWQRSLQLQWDVHPPQRKL